VSETDRFGRLLRYVFVGDLFVNYELVRAGFANPASFPPDVACEAVFSRAEVEARAEGAGLWAGEADCDCSGPDLDCGDFQTQAEAQACYDSCQAQGNGDVFRLDGEEKDGRACESLP
jgi:micrococcal nuclease